jgi:hypothetical protein
MTRHHHHMIPLDHDNATATVSITGLALGCYNRSTQNYEVGFLRHDDHALTIEVTKKQADGEDSVMLYRIIDHQHRIFIDAENAVTPRDPIYTVGEDFDRTQLDGDLEDFRWVIDFETDLNDGGQVQLQPPDVPVTEMYIEKPRLYGDTELMTQDPQFIVRIDPATNAPVAGEDPELFGFFTEGIKADITCQDGGAVVLRVDGPQGFQVHLPHGYGPHHITIKNICPPKAAGANGDGSGDTGTTGTGTGEPGPTDFRLYYSLIVDTAGEKFDIQAPPNSGEGAVCNGSTLGRSPSLFPLPSA